MKNRLIITISDIKGTKSYNVSKLLRRFFFWILALVLIIALAGAMFVPFLTNQIRYLTNLNANYEQALVEQTQNIQALDSALQKLEKDVGIAEDMATYTPIQRARIAGMTAKTKGYMLRIFPAGSPLEKTIVTSHYGTRIHPILRTKKFHYGIDLRASIGTPTKVTADGIVKAVESRNVGGFGKIVIVSHNYGFETAYAHLDTIKVKVGDVVQQGQIIATTGNTGRSSGPHLHYEVRYLGTSLNPSHFINWNMVNYETIFHKEGKVPWESLVSLIENQNRLIMQQ